MEEFKERQRAIWEAGDYPLLSEMIHDVGERVVDAAEIDPGMTVLDVACGSGNAAIQAAERGARVTGLDLAPALLDAGRRKAQQVAVEVAWVEGDAEELPFADGAFDRVLSTFGHMFAPRHRQTAGEMARVCRDGGVIAFATWLPEGTVAEMLRTSTSYMPPPPDFAEPPMLWGDEGHVRELFEPAASDIAFERHVNHVEAESVDAWADLFTNNFPPLVTAQAMLGERFAELRRDLVDIWERGNEADDGSFRFPQQYLVSVVHV